VYKYNNKLLTYLLIYLLVREMSATLYCAENYQATEAYRIVSIQITNYHQSS